MATVNLNRKSDTTVGELPPATREDILGAEFYQEVFVPALFAPWSQRIIDKARIDASHRVLDLACGTGLVARDILERVGPSQPPLGFDRSAGMLQVARRLEPRIDWRFGDAVSLPFADDSFDRVVCQFGLMFFSDRVRALREMRRVLKPGGRLVLSVWDRLERNPGYAEKVRVLDRIAGQAAGDALRAPFNLGDRNALERIARDAGLCEVEIDSCDGEACFDNLAGFVDADLRGWLPVMGVHLDESVRRRVHAACLAPLRRYEDAPGGRIVLPAGVHFLSCGG